MKIHDTATQWVGAPNTDTSPLLLVMHGFGANERDLAPLVPHLPAKFTAACVRAPLPIPQMPGGFAWFPITGDAGMPDLEIADAAAQGVMSWIDEKLGEDSHRPVIPLGFSQGGAMVTHLLRHYPERFASGVILSGFTVPGEVAGDARLKEIQPPVFFGFDPQDPVVPNSAFERTRSFGQEHFDLTVKTYPVGHGLNEQELRDVHEFLAQVNLD